MWLNRYKYTLFFLILEAHLNTSLSPQNRLRYPMLASFWAHCYDQSIEHNTGKITEILDYNYISSTLIYSEVLGLFSVNNIMFQMPYLCSFLIKFLNKT